MSVAESTEERNGVHVLTFTEALAQAEVQARVKLDPALHERLSCAVALVQHAKIEPGPHENEWWVIDPEAFRDKQRVMATSRCTCQDAATAPQHYCKHRLGVFLAHRVQELLATPPDRKSTRLNSSHLGISYAVF